MSFQRGRGVAHSAFAAWKKSTPLPTLSRHLLPSVPETNRGSTQSIKEHGHARKPRISSPRFWNGSFHPHPFRALTVGVAAVKDSLQLRLAEARPRREMELPEMRHMLMDCQPLGLQAATELAIRNARAQVKRSKENDLIVSESSAPTVWQ